MYVFILILFLIVQDCFSKKISGTEIIIESSSSWVVSQVYRFGRGEVKNKVSARIVEYQENPQFFKMRGEPVGYSLTVGVSYDINCGQEKFVSGEKFFSELFTSANPYSYKTSLQRARHILLEKIKNFLISETMKNCGNI